MKSDGILPEILATINYKKIIKTRWKSLFQIKIGHFLCLLINNSVRWIFGGGKNPLKSDEKWNFISETVRERRNLLTYLLEALNNLFKGKNTSKLDEIKKNLSNFLKYAKIHNFQNKIV